MPLTIPLARGWDIEARHVVAVSDSAASSAWFDVFVMATGHTMLVIGDVAGAADPVASAAEARTLVHEAFVDDRDLADDRGLDDAWRAVAATASERPTTRQIRATAVVLDPQGGSLWYATAAHRAPTLIDIAGARQLSPTATPALGELGGSGAQVARSARISLADGPVTLVLTSSDGSRLGPESGRSPLTDASADVTEDVLGSSSLVSDDGAVTVLVARRTAPLAALDLKLASERAAVRQTRSALEDWLAVLGAGPMDSLSLIHAALELVTNAVEHAYGPGTTPGGVEVRGEWGATGEIVIDVVDHGEWRTPIYDIARGRGLAMAAGLAHELEVQTNQRGTVARLRHRPTRPVVTGIHPAGSVPLSHLDVLVVAPGLVRLKGVLANDDVDELLDAVARAAAGASSTVEVDLSAVTALSPAVISALRDIARRAAADGLEGLLIVGPGTVPHLELVRGGIAHVLR